MSTIEVAAGIESLKSRLRTTWMAEDYDRFCRSMENGARSFYERLDVPPGAHLLDVACGSGQLALIAAREGARVTGVDIAENLIERAQARSMVEGLQTRFQVADAESLPFPDASFDVVVSLMGAMFAPRSLWWPGNSCASVFPAEPSQWRIGRGKGLWARCSRQSPSSLRLRGCLHQCCGAMKRSCENDSALESPT